MAFSPDGRTLAWAGWKGATVHLVETATGRERHSFLGQTGRILSLEFTADGKALISGAEDTTAIVWDLTGRLAAKGPRAKPPASADLDACWADLADDDAPKAFRTVQGLAEAPKDAVPYLQKRLRPAPAVDKKRIVQLIADLDSDEFDTRENASKELERFEDGVLGLLRKALEGKPSLDTRRRLEALVGKLSGRLRNPSPESRRVSRCLEVLEHIGTPEARQVLEVLAKGSPGARLTEEAKASLDRLAKRTATVP
jgi:hypothetical protein